MTNEELVAEYQNGNDKAFQVLYETNKGIIGQSIKRWFHLITNNIFTAVELENECLFAFWLAVRDYKSDCDCAFSTYAFSRISWYISKQQRKKKSPIITVSLDEPIPHSDGLTIGDSLIDESAEEEFQKFSTEKNNEFIRKRIIETMDFVLDDREKQVLLMHYGVNEEQCSFTGISEVLKITASRVQQIEQTAIRKLRDSPLKELFIEEFGSIESETKRKRKEWKERQEKENAVMVSYNDALSILNQL